VGSNESSTATFAIFAGKEALESENFLSDFAVFGVGM
jgi:hypothetical protein